MVLPAGGQQRTASSCTCYDLLVRKTRCITYLYRCESGGTSDEASVMGVEQQPLVGRLVSLPVDKTSVIK